MKIEIRENSITLDGVEYIKKEQAPKDGEVWCVVLNDEREWLIIFKSFDSYIYNYCAYSYSSNELYDGNTIGILTTRNNVKEYCRATPEQEAFLYSKLAEKGKKWNAETKTLEDLPKPLKEGDLAIFWDNDKRCAVIGVYKKSITVSYNSLFTHLRMGGVQYINAIPFESIEQYKEFIK